MRPILRTPLSVLAGLALTACAAAPPPDARAPGAGAREAREAPPPPPLPEDQAFAVRGTLKDEWLPLLKQVPFDLKSAVPPPAPAGVAAAPAACSAFVSRVPVPPPACADAQGGLAALDGALAETDEAKRDARLAGVESCSGLDAGLARALRADLAPVACGDVLAMPVLTAPSATLKAEVAQVLIGETIAARLARASREPPKMTPPFEVKRVLEFTKGTLFAWVTDQARAIEDLGRLGVELPFYAKAIVAVEAGMADMRLVEAVRSAPLPDAMQKDAELRNVYYAQLDQVLDLWKQRGRDAALVGLRELSAVGALRDRRASAARAMLSRLYGGRRIDALDALELPPLPPAAPSSLEERLAGALPTYYAGLLLPPDAAARPGTLRMFLERGVPLPQRAALRGASLSPEARVLYARARIELGRLYWRAVDFDQATALLTPWPDGARPATATALLALSLGLRNGPEDAALMMRRAPVVALGLGDVAALDWVARSSPRSPYAGIAAYDAALIKQLAAPQGADATYWADVAARFREAKSLLSGAAAASAEEHARAAEATARAIQ